MKKLEELGVSPAPWSANKNNNVLSGRPMVSDVFGNDLDDSDANLIAAAPELYEELRKAYEFIEQVGDAVGGLPEDVVFNQYNARKALDKAAGEEVENG